MPNFVQSSRTPCRYPSGGIRIAVRADDGLQDEGRDRLRPFQLDRLFQDRERGLRVVEPALRTVVGVEHVHHAGHGRLFVRPATRITRQHHRAVGRTVVAAVASHHLLPSGDELGDLHGVLVRLGPRQGEERLLHVAGPQPGEALAQHRASLERLEGRDVGELLGLTCDRFGDALVAVPDVHPHQLGTEVEPAPAVGAVHVHAFGAVDRERRRLRLRLPVIQRVALGIGDDLLGAHGADVGGHGRSLSRSGHARAFTLLRARSLPCRSRWCRSPGTNPRRSCARRPSAGSPVPRAGDRRSRPRR